MPREQHRGTLISGTISHSALALWGNRKVDSCGLAVLNENINLKRKV